MNQAVGHGPPANTTQLVRMDSHNGMRPVCPRCAHQSHLIFGLLKTLPVCVDCAVDPTWTNPQENWPEGGVVVSGGGPFEGEIGPCRIIVQHPKYTVLEEVFGRREILIVYKTGAYKLPRRSGNTLNNHAAKFKMPNATTQPEKSNMQYLGQANATNITQDETKCAMTSKQTNLSHNVHVHPSDKMFLASKPQTIKLLNSKEDVSRLVVSENRAKQLESFVEKSCLAQLLEKNNKEQVLKHLVSKVRDSRKLNDGMNVRDAYVRNWRHNQEVKAMVENVQTTTVPGFRLNTKPPQRKHGNTYMVSQQANGIQSVGKIHTPNMCCALEKSVLQNCGDMWSDCCGQAYETNWTFTQDASRIRSEAVSINAQHASLTRAGNLVQHVRLLEGVTVCPYEVTIQENVYHPEFDKLHEDELRNWHQNNIISYEFDQCNAFSPTFTTSAEHVTPTSANNWPCKVATHHIIPSDAETRSECHCELPNQKAFPCSITPEADEQTTVKATNWIGRMAAQQNQMPAKTLPKQNMNSNSVYRNEFVDPRQLPQQATSVAQVQSPTEAMDLMYKMATEENQMEAAKLSNEKVDILYPCSIFSSNSADPNSQTTATEQGKFTDDVIIVDSEIATTEKCSQIEPVELGNRQTQSSCYPYSVFNLVDPTPMATATEQGKPTQEGTAMASNSATTENWALIELEKLCNQPVLSSGNIYDVANSEPNPVATAQVMPVEDVVEMAFMMATQENYTQIQKEISSDKDVGIMQPPSNPCNQPNKPDTLPKTAPFPDIANSPQKGTDLIQQTASEDKNPHIEEASKSTNTERNPCAITSVGKLHVFDTINDLMYAIKTHKFPSNNNVQSNKPNLQKTSVSTKEKDSEKEDTGSGPCLAHHHPKMSDLEFTFPDKTSEIVEAESPQKRKSGTTTLAFDQQNCADTRVTEQVTNQSDDIWVQDKNTDRLQSIIEIERHKLRTQRAIIKQLKRLLTRPKCDVVCAEDVADNEYREKQTATTDISDLTHPRSKDALLEDADCPNKESTILNTSNSNYYNPRETQTIIHPEIKRTLIKEVNVGSKGLRDEGTDLTMPRIKEKKRNQEQKEELDTMKIGTDELHDFERSRLARDKKIHGDPVAEITMTIQKVESLMATKSGNVLLEKDIKCGATKGKLSTKSNPRTEFIEDQKLPKEDADPKIISKKLKVEMLDMVPCQKKVEKPEEDLKQASKTLTTPQHKSFQAFKSVHVYGNQPTAVQLEKAKASEVVLRNEKSLGSTELGRNLGRKRDYNETHSSESSKDDKTPLKTRFKSQEFEIAAKKPKLEVQESNSKCCKKEISEAQAEVQPLNCPEDVSKLANAKNVEKPRVGQTNIAKPEFYSKKEGKEEQINHMATGSVAIQRNKAKLQMRQNQEKGNTLDLKTCETVLDETRKTPSLYKEVKSLKAISDEATSLAKAIVETQQNTSPSKGYKGESPKQQITVPVQKVKSQNTIPDEATNLANASSVERQQHTSPSKGYKEGESPKQQIKVPVQKVKSQNTIPDEETNLANARSVERQQNTSPSKSYKEGESPKQQITVPVQTVKSKNSTSGEATNLAKARSVERLQNTSPSKSHKEGESPNQQIKVPVQKEKSQITIPDEKKNTSPSKTYKEGESPKQQITVPVQKVKSQNTIPDEATNLAKARSVERQQNTSPSKGYKEGESPNQQITVPVRKVKSQITVPDEATNLAKARSLERQKNTSPMITQKPFNYHYLQKEWNPKPYPDFNAMSKRGAFSSNTPQDSKGFGDQEREICVDNVFVKAQRMRFYPASERLFIPDRAMPRNPAYIEETHPRQHSHHLQNMSKEHWVQNHDYQSDARNIKRKRLPSETHEDREFAPPHPRGFDKHRDREERAKVPRISPRTEGERQNASKNMLLASMPGLESPSCAQERGEIKEPVLLDIQMHFFDKNSRTIELNQKEESIYKWSKIVIKTVRSDGRRTDVNKAKNVNWERMTNILTGCANPHLIFRERKPRDGIISKFTRLMRVMYWNNTLEICIYAHAFGLWLRATQHHDAPNLQKRKYFFTNVEHEKVTRQDDGGEIERRNKGESHEAVKSHEVANNERHCELPRRYTGQYSNEADESARDRKRTWYRKPHMEEKGLEGERHHPTHKDGPRDSFSRDRGDYNRRKRLDSK